MRWFAVEQTEFYKFSADGTCVKSQKPPTARGTAGGSLESGYWFVRGPEVIIFWPRQGQVARFTIARVVFGPLAAAIQGFVGGLVARIKQFVP